MLSGGNPTSAAVYQSLSVTHSGCISVKVRPMNQNCSFIISDIYTESLILICICHLSSVWRGSGWFCCFCSIFLRWVSICLDCFTSLMKTTTKCEPYFLTHIHIFLREIQQGSNWSKVTVKTFRMLIYNQFQIDSVLLNFLFIKES